MMGTAPSRPRPAATSVSRRIESRGRVLPLAGASRAAPAPDTVVPEHVVLASRGAAPESVATILKWCEEVTGADAVFIVNDQGLIAGALGSLTGEELDQVGSRLSIALDQASRMGTLRGPLHSLAFELDNLWLTGLLVDIGSDRTITLGMLSNEPVRHDVKLAIRDLLYWRFGHQPKE